MPTGGTAGPDRERLWPDGRLSVLRSGRTLTSGAPRCGPPDGTLLIDTLPRSGRAPAGLTSSSRELSLWSSTAVSGSTSAVLSAALSTTGTSVRATVASVSTALCSGSGTSVTALRSTSCSAACWVAAGLAASSAASLDTAPTVSALGAGCSFLGFSTGLVLLVNIALMPPEDDRASKYVVESNLISLPSSSVGISKRTAGFAGITSVWRSRPPRRRRSPSGGLFEAGRHAASSPLRKPLLTGGRTGAKPSPRPRSASAQTVKAEFDLHPSDDKLGRVVIDGTHDCLQASRILRASQGPLFEMLSCLANS